MAVTSPTRVPRTEPFQAVSAPVAPPKGLRRFWRSGQVRLGVLLLVVTTLAAFIGPLLMPYDPSKSVAAPYAHPGDGLLLGADQLGRDVLSRVLAGGVYLAWMAPAAAVLGVAVGALIGLLAAFYGRFWDAALMRLVDVILAFPGILFALLFVSLLGPKPWLLVVLTAIALVPGVARVIRGAARPLVRSEYVLWARAAGVPGRTILSKEILPNVSSPLLVELGIRLMWAVDIIASMSFIGYGIQPPTPDWGLMVSENRTGLSTQPLAVLVPIVFIVLFTVGGNLISEGAARVIARTEGKK